MLGNENRNRVSAESLQGSGADQKPNPGADQSGFRPTAVARRCSDWEVPGFHPEDPRGAHDLRERRNSVRSLSSLSSGGHGDDSPLGQSPLGQRSNEVSPLGHRSSFAQGKEANGLRKMLGIKAAFVSRVSNAEVLAKARYTSASQILRKHRLQMSVPLLVGQAKAVAKSPAKQPTKFLNIPKQVNTIKNYPHCVHKDYMTFFASCVD